MQRFLRTTALAVALVAAAGCAQTFDATTLGVPATLAADNVAAPQGTAFKVNAKALWAAWGLDGINTLGTFGVLSPRSVTYEGVIVEAPPSQ